MFPNMLHNPGLGTAFQKTFPPQLLRSDAGVSDFISLAAISVPFEIPAIFGPLYRVLSVMALRAFRFDIRSPIMKALFVAGVVQGTIVGWSYLKPSLIDWFTSTISLPHTNLAQRHVKSWMKQNLPLTRDRHVEVFTEDDDIHDDQEDGYRNPFVDIPAVTKTKEVHEVSYKLPTSRFFWHRRRLFYYTTSTHQRTNTITSAKGDVTQAPSGEPEVKLVLMTLGRSLTPLRSFLHECKKQHEASVDNTTISYSRTEMSQHWGMSHERPSRPLSTIDLDEKLKTALVADINEYLSPLRAKWYSDRGIPYRRGFLFHGPPGCGKTSMAKALAGHFHLPLFSTSLSRNMTEGTLESLFRQLPKRCIVLLEDIDSAGIQREEMKQVVPEQPLLQAQAQQPEHYGYGMPSSGYRELARAVHNLPPGSLFGPQGLQAQSSRVGVSLSCLLNVIDGPNSEEGRVLIMTTNTPESLDRALIRPGRIDMQVFFGPVSRKVAASIFRRMYMLDTPPSGVIDKKQEEELAEQADSFAAHVPELKFTPAEVQTFLTMHRTPEQAIAGAQDWVDKLLVSKEKGLNVITGETDTPGDSSSNGSDTDGSETGGSDTDVSDTEEPPKKADREPDVHNLLSSALHRIAVLEERASPPALRSDSSDETMVDEVWQTPLGTPGPRRLSDGEYADGSDDEDEGHWMRPPPMTAEEEEAEYGDGPVHVPSA